MIFFCPWPSCRFLRCLWCVSGSGMESILQRSQPVPCQNRPTLFQNVPKLMKGPGCLAHFHSEPGVGTSHRGRNQFMCVFWCRSQRNAQCIAPPPHPTLEQNLPCKRKAKGRTKQRMSGSQTCLKVANKFHYGSRLVSQRQP